MDNITLEIRDNQTDELLDTIEAPMQMFLGWVQEADARNMSVSQYMQTALMEKLLEDFKKPKAKKKKRTRRKQS